MSELWITIAKALIEGIPKIIEAVKKGRNLKDMKLEEFISTDALEKIQKANNDPYVDDFIKNG